jgi:hypothetical protein
MTTRAKSQRGRNSEPLIVVEQVVEIGEVREGEGDLHPVVAAFAIISDIVGGGTEGEFRFKFENVRFTVTAEVGEQR